MNKGVTVRVRWAELSAVLLWMTVIVLAVWDSNDGKVGLAGLWAMLLAVPAGVCSKASWDARAGDEFQRGLDRGLETAHIIRMQDHERL